MTMVIPWKIHADLRIHKKATLGRALRDEYPKSDQLTEKAARVSRAAIKSGVPLNPRVSAVCNPHAWLRTVRLAPPHAEPNQTETKKQKCPGRGLGNC